MRGDVLVKSRKKDSAENWKHQPGSRPESVDINLDREGQDVLDIFTLRRRRDLQCYSDVILILRG